MCGDTVVLGYPLKFPHVAHYSKSRIEFPTRFSIVGTWLPVHTMACLSPIEAFLRLFLSQVFVLRDKAQDYMEEIRSPSSSCEALTLNTSLGIVLV